MKGEQRPILSTAIEAAAYGYPGGEAYTADNHILLEPATLYIAVLVAGREVGNGTGGR
jgi:hypothetical protein